MTTNRIHISTVVYGTLKRGQWNHDRFCRHAIDIRPATMVGRLYDLPAGFPALEIPEETILAVGTGDPLADAETQTLITARDLVMPEAEGDPPSPEGYGEAGWDIVHGELITFADPARDLPPLDRLEGFRPDGHGLYRRALVAVRANTGVEAVWVYHMVGINRGQRLRGGVWPSVAPQGNALRLQGDRKAR
jgi:gamma-glutamylcyclotransferase (GGCT)/AIG2-like uncharacterized protein YtfP